MSTVAPPTHGAATTRRSADVGDLAALWSASRAVARRHLYKWITRPANLVPTLLFPLFFLTSFSGGLAALRHLPGFDYRPGYTSFVFVFSLLQTNLFGGMSTGFSIAGDFETGFARRLLLTTRSRLAILLGYLLSTFARAALMSCVITGVALLAGLHLGFSDPAHLAGLYALGLSMSLVGTLWASGVMFRGRSAQFAPAMQFPMFAVVFLAPVYLPLALLHGWIHAVALRNPTTYLLEAGRALLGGTTDHVVVALSCVVGLLVVFGAWSVRGLRSAERAG